MYRFVGKRNDEEGAKEKLFTYASHVIVESFKVRSPLSLLTLRTRKTYDDVPRVSRQRS